MKTLKKYKKIIIVIEVIALFMILYDFLIDGGATASYYYGPLQPEE